jgi:hypothetical protein
MGHSFQQLRLFAQEKEVIVVAFMSIGRNDNGNQARHCQDS